MNPIPDAVPAGFAAYARSPDFTPDNLPAKLQAAHTTKAGTWAMLHVLEGQVLYELEPPRSGQRLVGAGWHVVIEAQVFHHVRFIEPGRFFVEFFRSTDPVKA
ncbi:MAG TPA: DUF1971 domain-containing protein [Devosia sp.]|nr:DUF1971 domain-containing protein [Devosia sp.]